TSARLAQTKAGLLIELAHYRFQSDPVEQEKKLLEAKRFCEEALKLDERNPDTLHTYGFILEDVAWLFPKREDRFKLFKKACDTLEAATKLADPDSGQAVARLALGRARFKWAEALQATGRASEVTEAEKLFGRAEDDLKYVREYSRSNIEKAEDYYWHARIAGKLKRPDLAKDYFKRARDLAQK